MVAGAELLVRLSLFVLVMVAATAEARGVSPYLPVDISPEIERKIERVLILADQPTLKRPFAAATVIDALPRACERDRVLCEEVRKYVTSLARTAARWWGVPAATRWGRWSRARCRRSSVPRSPTTRRRATTVIR